MLPTHFFEPSRGEEGVAGAGPICSGSQFKSKLGSFDLKRSKPILFHTPGVISTPLQGVSRTSKQPAKTSRCRETHVPCCATRGAGTCLAHARLDVNVFLDSTLRRKHRQRVFVFYWIELESTTCSPITGRLTAAPRHYNHNFDHPRGNTTASKQRVDAQIPRLPDTPMSHHSSRVGNAPTSSSRSSGVIILTLQSGNLRIIPISMGKFGTLHDALQLLDPGNHRRRHLAPRPLHSTRVQIKRELSRN